MLSVLPYICPVGMPNHLIFSVASVALYRKPGCQSLTWISYLPTRPSQWFLTCPAVPFDTRQVGASSPPAGLNVRPGPTITGYL